MSFVTDYIAEGRLVFHARCFTESYYTQKEETQGHIEWFKKDRLPRFMQYFENSLSFNQKAKKSDFFIGESLTYVDIAVWHTLEATAS
jgi:glutathione S-transferase